MSLVESLLDEAARSEQRGEHAHALTVLDRAGRASSDPRQSFDVLLARAGVEACGLEQPNLALSTYETARELSREHHLGRSGEADLGLALAALAMDRPDKARAALRRANRAFRAAGQLLRRGFAEMLLGHAALQEEEDDQADLHLRVAIDLLSVGGEESLVAAVLRLRAGIAARAGRAARSRRLLQLAGETAAPTGASIEDLCERSHELLRRCRSREEA